MEKNITLYYAPGGYFWKQFLQDSSIPEYKILGENMILADDWDHYYYIAEHYVFGAGTHAKMRSKLGSGDEKLGENKEINNGRGWYRSKDTLAGKFSYAGYLTNKKWHLNEVIISS